MTDPRSRVFKQGLVGLLQAAGFPSFLRARNRDNAVTMSTQKPVLAKKRRGPLPTGQGKMVGVRFQPDLLAKLDAFIAAQPKSQSRPEAIRALVEVGMHLAHPPRWRPRRPTKTS
jgi:hypothetical protein